MEYLYDSTPPEVHALPPDSTNHRRREESMTPGITSLLRTTEEIENKPKRYPGVHVNSSWIGNRWFPSLDVLDSIPSNDTRYYRRQLYNPQELRDIFSHYDILWIGDSLGGQEYATLSRILNSSNNNIDLFGKDFLEDPWNMDTIMTTDPQQQQQQQQQQQNICLDKNMTICRSHQGKLFDWLYRKCVHDLNMTNWQELFHNYSLIILSIGANDLALQCNTSQDETDSKLKHFTSLIQDLTKIEREGLMVVYRTMGSIGSIEDKPDLDKTSWHDAARYNDILVSQINEFQESYLSKKSYMPVLSYVDFGSIILPHHSYPDTLRIRGSLPIHYGVEARVALIQMLAIHLIEREEERKLKPSIQLIF
jgi:hypothetical protein